MPICSQTFIFLFLSIGVRPPVRVPMIPNFFIDAHYRGMGDSSLTLAGDEEITIELLARDLLFLLENLGWKEVALCGHSMGGTSPHVEPRLLYQVMSANV